MNKDAFIAAYKEFAGTVLALAEKVKREGILSLEENLDEEKANARQLFHYGLRYVIDGVDTLIIDKILSNIMEQEKDEYARKFLAIQKEAVLGLQLGYNSRILHGLMNSYTDLAENYDEMEIAYTPQDNTAQREIEENTVFEKTIIPLDNRAIQKLMRELDSRDLATALANMNDSVWEKFFSNMSDRAAEMLKEDIRLLGPVRNNTALEAQEMILSVLQRLIEEGEIII